MPKPRRAAPWRLQPAAAVGRHLQWPCRSRRRAGAEGSSGKRPGGETPFVPVRANTHYGQADGSFRATITLDAAITASRWTPMDANPP